MPVAWSPGRSRGASAEGEVGAGEGEDGVVVALGGGEDSGGRWSRRRAGGWIDGGSRVWPATGSEVGIQALSGVVAGKLLGHLEAGEERF